MFRPADHSTRAVETRFPLNTAQLRNLRNWAADDWGRKTLTVVTEVGRPMSPAGAEAALTALVRMHQALRSRLVRADDGALVQEVMAPCQAEPHCTRVALSDEDAAEIRRPDRVSPWEQAARYTCYLRDGQVVLVKLTLSHLFADALGTQALARDLKQLLDGAPPCAPPRQAEAYARGPADPAIRAHTGYWVRLLADAPRGCTYSGAARDEHEKVRVFRRKLTPDEEHVVDSACRRLRITPHTLWAATGSVLVSRIAGQHDQVYRSTFANRFTRADFGAVVQLAQAVYLPVAGTAQDTLGDRVRLITSAFMSSFDKGCYDAVGMLARLNTPEAARGAVFQPAFELNYVPNLYQDTGETVREPVLDRTVEADVRIDPPSAKADLLLSISQARGLVVQLSARRPVSRQRDPGDLVEDCLTVVGVLAENPDTLVADVPVEPFPATAALWRGHRSGLAVDIGRTRDLVLSCPGVLSCELTVGKGRLHALVRGTVGVDDLRRELWARQPWLSGTVVPDDLVIEGTQDGVRSA